MKICECYDEYEDVQYLSDFEQGVHFALTGERIKSVKVKRSRCTGTKECESCSCGGDRMKCDFYPEERAEAKKEKKAEEAKKKARTINGGWIDVKMRLPDIGRDVLIYTTDGTIVVDHRYTASRMADPSEFTHHNAQYWRPLPEKPSECTRTKK